MSRSTAEISAIMVKVGSRDTPAEVILRKALWAKGLRYRLCVPNLPGKPDIVVTSRKLAIFVDGDYWHGNQWARRGLLSLEEQFNGASAPYWSRKIRSNMERDCRAVAELTARGWNVIRFWESDVARRLNECVDMVINFEPKKLPAPEQESPRKTVAEFFAGIGLMRLGLEAQGWSVVYANDIDPKKRAMYWAHFGEEMSGPGSGPSGANVSQDPQGMYHLEDIRNVYADAVPRAALATASFPCNDLSVAGKQRGLAGAASSMFWEFIRIMEEMGSERPPWILLENVPGFLSSRKGEDFRDALLALNELGYAVDAFIIDAARFVPQSRKRLFVMASLTAHERFPYSASPSFDDDVLRPKRLVHFMRANADINWRIRLLPEPPQSSTTLEDVLERDEDLALGWWNATKTEYLLTQMSPRHSVIAQEMTHGEAWSYGTIFRRVRKGRAMAELRTDGTAGCLRTPRGGSGRQLLLKAGFGRRMVRLITPRECARLMGADNFVVENRLNEALFGFGDAVCAPVIAWVAKHYLNPILNEALRTKVFYARDTDGK